MQKTIIVQGASLKAVLWEQHNNMMHRSRAQRTVEISCILATGCWNFGLLQISNGVRMLVHRQGC